MYFFLLYSIIMFFIFSSIFIYFSFAFLFSCFCFFYFRFAAWTIFNFCFQISFIPYVT